MVCGNCGNFVQDGAPNCPTCGAPTGMNPGGMNQPPMGMNPGGMNQPPMGMNPNGMNQGPMGMYQDMMGMTKKQFYKHPAMKQIKSSIVACGIAGYIITGINLLLAFLMPISGANLLDTLLILGLTLGIHLGKSRVCSILLAVYGVYNLIIVLLVMHQLSGWLIPVIGIAACTSTFKFQSAWKKYQATGQIDPK